MDQSATCVAVLVVGDLFSHDMRSVQRRVEELARNGCAVRIFPNLVEALPKCSADAWHPDLVIVCLHWPDQYTAFEVRQMLTAFGLARAICCYGPWCGSDGRTRDVWPLSIRIPAEFAPRRIDLELEVLAGTRWPLPLTAARDEIFVFDPDNGIAAS